MGNAANDDSWGIHCSLLLMKPFLSEVNPHATLVTRFTTAMDEIIRDEIKELQMNEEDITNVKPYFPPSRPSEPRFSEKRIIRWMGSFLFKDYNPYFDRYEFPGGSI